ncbi:MAG: hypothetical protein KDA96_16100, partial [Planctomycetaceae bacterium]|nr:hypothetical protein [Planctomycetaceae bacterium]
SLQTGGLVTTAEADYLEASQGSGHIDWGLMHVGRSAELAARSRANRIFTALPLLVVLLIGAFVGWVVVAMFSPLLKLINDIAVFIPPVVYLSTFVS